MGYTTSDGRWADTTDLDLSPAAEVTEDGYSDPVELGDRAVARLTLAATAATGTDPTLDVTIQTSSDGTTYYDAGAFTQLTATGSEQKLFMLDRWVRAHFEVGGTTPSFTVTLKGEAA